MHPATPEVAQNLCNSRGTGSEKPESVPNEIRIVELRKGNTATVCK